jgi:predicted nucleic acid-binding Zn ribbon protein
MTTPGEARKRPRRNWIQEERRRTLGDWVAFCLACGHVVRYFEGYEDVLPTACPQCDGGLRHRCPACDARLPSAFQVECEECGAPVRNAELFGGPIRRSGR